MLLKWARQKFVLPKNSALADVRHSNCRLCAVPERTPHLPYRRDRKAARRGLIPAAKPPPDPWRRRPGTSPQPHLMCRKFDAPSLHHLSPCCATLHGPDASPARGRRLCKSLFRPIFRAFEQDRSRGIAAAASRHCQFVPHGGITTCRNGFSVISMTANPTIFPVQIVRILTVSTY
jgi:hypothetical protein